MIKLRTYYFGMLVALFSSNVMADNRVVLERSDEVDTSDIDAVNEILLDQNFLETLFVNKPGIVVTPYYDEYGRWGAKVVPDRGEPYYVDPYYEDAMQTNRHSDEAVTSSNWRMMVW